MHSERIISCQIFASNITASSIYISHPSSSAMDGEMEYTATTTASIRTFTLTCQIKFANQFIWMFGFFWKPAGITYFLGAGCAQNFVELKIWLFWALNFQKKLCRLQKFVAVGREKYLKNLVTKSMKNPQKIFFSPLF